MPPALALAVALAAVLLAAPASAAAQSRTIRPDVARDGVATGLSAGVRLAGDDVLWLAARRPRDVALVADGPAGRRVLASLPSPGADTFGLETDGDRVGAVAFRYDCEDDDEACARYGDRYPKATAVHLGTVRGDAPPPRPEGSCETVAVDVAADATLLGCGRAGAPLLTDAGGSRRVDAVQVAGAYLAGRVGDEWAVRRRSDDAVVARLPARFLDTLHLAADGSAVVRTQEGMVLHASPEAPQARRLDLPGPASVARAAPGRVAVAVGRLVVVLDGQGRVLGRHDAGDRVGGLDLDARRAAWFTDPCGRAAVAVWELAQAPPAPTVPCGIPRPTARSGRASRAGVLTVTLRCPPAARSGCAGEVLLAATGRDERGRRRVLPARTSAEVLLDPGATRRVSAALSGRARRVLGRLRGRGMRVQIAGDGTARRTARTSLTLR